MCTKQDQDREKGIHSPVSHTLSDYHYLPWFQAAWAPCQELKFFFIKHDLHVNGIYLFIYLFIHYATEAAQTYKIKHKVKTQSIKNSKNTTQERNQIQISTV